jgi:Tfp pilus assembly protein PilO
MFSGLPNDLERHLKLLGWGLHGLGALGLLGGAWLLTVGVYGPLEEHREDCMVQSARLDRLLDDSTQIRAENARLTAALKKLQEQRDSLQRRVPDDPREAEFLEQVTEVARDAGLHIHDYRPGTVTATGEYSRMEIGLSCACTYPGMCDFLHRLATLPRLANVTKMEVLAPSPEEMYTVNLTLIIYFGVGKATELAKGGGHV